MMPRWSQAAHRRENRCVEAAVGPGQSGSHASSKCRASTVNVAPTIPSRKPSPRARSCPRHPPRHQQPPHGGAASSASPPSPSPSGAKLTHHRRPEFGGSEHHRLGSRPTAGSPSIVHRDIVGPINKMPPFGKGEMAERHPQCDMTTPHLSPQPAPSLRAACGHRKRSEITPTRQFGGCSCAHPCPEIFRARGLCGIATATASCSASSRSSDKNNTAGAARSSRVKRESYGSADSKVLSSVSGANRCGQITAVRTKEAAG